MPARNAPLAIAVISEHASPLGLVGGVDAGGQNVYVARIARALAARGHRVDVFTRRDAPDLPRVAEVDGYRVFHVKAGPPRFVRKEDFLDLMPEFTEDVARLVAEHGPYDLAHANFWLSGMTAAELKRRFGIPFAITFHALGKVRRQHQGADDQFPDARLTIEAELVRAADCIIAECPQDEFDLVTLYGADRRRLTMIPCGHDPEECAPVDRAEARARLGLHPNAPVVLQLGRLVPRKGVDTVVRSTAIVAGELPDTRLVVVGGDSDVPDPEATPELGRLFQLARQLRIEDRCHFVGRRPRSEIRYWYSAADVFATAPWYEPFGITPVEAMACGTPVVGTRVGGIQYTVEHEGTGLLVPPHDEFALAQALGRILSDHGLHDRLAAGGRERVARLFTWDRVARDLESTFLGMVAHRPAALPSQPAVPRAVEAGFDALIETLTRDRRQLAREVTAAADIVTSGLAQGRKLLLCGNGGSASDAVHLAGELVGRYRAPDRPGLPAVVLGGDLASLTAWSNDVSYESAFARQVEAFGRDGDVLIAFSTSGRSASVVRACEAARAAGMPVVAFLGRDGGRVAALADGAVVVRSHDTQRIQEVHGLLLHLLCDLVEEGLGYGVDHAEAAGAGAA
ncbi:MAG: glycosyltransferase [Dehalococcoidia bacterium]